MKERVKKALFRLPLSFDEAVADLLKVKLPENPRRKRKARKHTTKARKR